MLELIVAAIFVSVALLTAALLYPVLSRRDSVRERIAKLAHQEEEQATSITHTPTKWQMIIADLGAKIKTRPTDLNTYRQTITAAGFRTETVYVFVGSKLLLAIALPMTYVVLVALPKAKLFDSMSLILTIAFAIFGYLAPTFWLSRRAGDRKTEIFHALPDVLDLLTVCVEAGLSLDAAMIKTEENFEIKNPLIKEINKVTLEIRAGRPRSEALRALAERTMVDDIKAFVSLLVQTERFGTSLGQTLRTYSDSLRTKRKQMAEEQAAKTAVKMLIPLTFCVFPALLVVILAPAAFRILAVFK